MPRKLLIETDEVPFHIFNRSNNKEFFYLDLDSLWKIFLDTIQYLSNDLGCEVHAFIMMSNHYHMTISTPRKNLSAAMTYFHREVAKKANYQSGRTNHFFGGRYKWSYIFDETYYWNATKYIFRNPIAAGLCDNVEDYKFSSLNDQSTTVWKMIDFFRNRNLPIILDRDWLNESFEESQAESIRKGLRRREFQTSVGTNRKKIILDAMPRKKELGTY